MENFSWIWFLIIIFSLMPMFRQKRLEGSRIGMIRMIEQERKSRLITLIHRQESLSLFGFALRRYINLEDSEQILRAIRMTPDNMPIDLVLHTPGGLVLAAEQIARALKKHPAKVTVIVPQYAMSGGTLIALAADEILLDPNGVMGPIDPQIGRYPASSVIRVLKEKPMESIGDETIMLADVAEKAMQQVYQSAVELLTHRMAEPEARELAKVLSEGRWTHDHALICSTLSSMGLPVSCNLPENIHKLMGYYQPARQNPGVDFVPLQY